MRHHCCEPDVGAAVFVPSRRAIHFQSEKARRDIPEPCRVKTGSDVTRQKIL